MLPGLGRSGFRPAAVPRDAGGKLADFGLDGNPVGVGETSQRGDAFDVAIEGSRRIRRHDQVESTLDGQCDPIVRGTFIEEEAERAAARLRAAYQLNRSPASRSCPLRKPPLKPTMMGERVCSAASITPCSDSMFQLSK